LPKQHHPIYIILKEGWLYSEKAVFFQRFYDRDIFLVPQQQSIIENNSYGCKQLEHLIHATYNAQTNMLEGSQD
jgi:hypothetical protein